MQIIPVIDLKDGLVVHASGGDRSRYRPIHLHSQIVGGSSIEEVVSGLLELYAFSAFYIADLNAIERNGSHRSILEPLLSRYPAVDFWLDNGLQPRSLTPNPAPNLRTVIGTETQSEPTDLSGSATILSLDFKNNQALGNPAWLDLPQYWPDTVIAMTLDQVGANRGPDFARLDSLRRVHPGSRWIAAGGVRGIDDLHSLAATGLSGVLIASALHNGSIGTAELSKF
ncbi:HisA/HisF-related TIM barrel protein [Methylomonas sp. SURF-1]|uniref:HisA/HisF-related TIM barrel protein n=1 Tax=Methylomonas aurea TaxID=2952224 RepID=A0ABT1UIL6_9GAMM|nr:HisA/HisF-related TIM barrel protein [Methylomonas sp. SURF-1]MCQ8181668.1 HisA/HisF-related TIM barrel protein [Methylomonas sp. SURF-1]